MPPIFFIRFSDFVGRFLEVNRHLAHGDESADNINAHFNGAGRIQDIRGLECAMLRECVRKRVHHLEFVVANCGRNFSDFLFYKLKHKI